MSHRAGDTAKASCRWCLQERLASEQAAQRESGAGQFELMIIENLKKAGVQNTAKNERLKFERLERYRGGVNVHAEGEYIGGGCVRRAREVKFDRGRVD